MKKPYTEIEEIIENRIAELEEEYELDRWDIAEIRLEAYKENGWSHDPFPEEDPEDDYDEDEEYHYRTMEQQLWEVGMNMRDFL